MASKSPSTTMKQVISSSRRCLHTTAPRHGSPFFALAALSNSRETNHLSKFSKLSRVQHSPSLQLIQSSEVFPFASPVPPESTIAAVSPVLPEPEAPVPPISEADMLSVGRAILAAKDAEIVGLREELEEEQDRAIKREASYTSARQKSRERIQRLSEDVSSARTWKWIFLLLGGSVAVWTYSREDVKKAWGAATMKEASKVKAVPKPRPTPVAPVVNKPAPAVATPAAVSPVKLSAQPEKKSSWNIFWIR